MGYKPYIIIVFITHVWYIMVYFYHDYPLFTYTTGWFLDIFFGQMLVNIPYMEHMGNGTSY